jgi:DNA modification methylase
MERSDRATVIVGDCLAELKKLQDQSVHCCVTSPPYWGLRDYGVDGQIGLEETPEEYVQKLVEVFREVRRVLRDDGTLWLNLGDTYISTAPGTMGDNIHIQGTLEATKRARKIERRKKPAGLKPKDLVGIPWRVAFALQADGWYLRSDIIWHKSNPMPESVRDRPTRAHEYIFLFSKNRQYYYDAKAIMEPCVQSNQRPVAGSLGTLGSLHSRRRSGNKARKYSAERGRPGHHLAGSIPWEGTMRNKRDVWQVATAANKEAHFAQFPPKLIEPCILAGCPEGGIVLDPFAGLSTTGVVALQHGRQFIGIEINPQYAEMSRRRLMLENSLIFA